MADLFRLLLTGIGAATVSLVLLAVALWARTSLRERREARRPLPDLDELSPDALARLRADIEALERGEKP